MAKWGEGDPRWIVEERPDAANCNNWHWTEKNGTPWSRDRLKDLLIGQSVSKGPLKFELTEFKKLEGEATANNRKAKLIFLFEWEIEVKFKATIAGSDTVYEGHLEIPNLSDENEASEVDVTVDCQTKGAHESEVRHVGSHEMKDFVRRQLEVYIRELKEEFSKGLILPTEKPKPQDASAGKSNVVDKRAFQNEVIAGQKKNVETKTASSGPVEVKSFESKETMKVPPERLYEILTDPQLVQAWSNGAAKMEAKAGGSFSLLGGQISGTFENVKENESLTMKWRLKKYPENHFANITMTLKDQNDSTDLIIKAENIPAEFLDETREGINRYYIQSISRTFGCGIKLF